MATDSQAPPRSAQTPGARRSRRVAPRPLEPLLDDDDDDDEPLPSLPRADSIAPTLTPAAGPAKAPTPEEDDDLYGPSSDDFELPAVSELDDADDWFSAPHT